MFGFARISRVRDLEERLRKVEGELQRTLLDAEALFEKARSLLGRTVKRAGLAAAPDEEPRDGRPSNVDPISWRIIQRRAGPRRGPTNGA